MTDYKVYDSMSIGEVLDVVDAMSKGNAIAEELVIVTCFYAAKCAREIMIEEHVAPDVIERVVSKLTPSDPANAVS